MSGFPPGSALPRAGFFPNWLFSKLTPDTAALPGEFLTPTRVVGRVLDNHWILGRDSDARRGENGEMSPDNHLSVQNTPDNAAMSGTRLITPPRPEPAMERHPARSRLWNATPPETRPECNPTTKNLTATVRDPSNVLQ